MRLQADDRFMLLESSTVSASSFWIHHCSNKHRVNGRKHLAASWSGDLAFFGEVTIHTFTRNNETWRVIFVLHFSLVFFQSVPTIKFDSSITTIYNIFTIYLCKKNPSVSKGVGFWGGTALRRLCGFTNTWLMTAQTVLTLLFNTWRLFNVHKDAELQILPRGIAMKFTASMRINYPDERCGSRWNRSAHESMCLNGSTGE